MKRRDAALPSVDRGALTQWVDATHPDSIAPPRQTCRMNPASNLVLVGPMGAGKSSIGRRLAGRFGLRFVDADREIERQTGTSIATIFGCEGEDGFRARERTLLAEVLAADGLLLATGGGAVLDAGTRDLLRARAFVVHLHVAPATQLARLARDRVRPLLGAAGKHPSDREALLRDLAAVRDPLYRDVADLRFETGEAAPGHAAVALGHLLDGVWQRAATATDAASVTAASAP